MDALLDSRSHGTMKAGRIEMLNEFMSEWDGLLSHAKSAEIIGNQKNSTAGNSVIVMGATNRPFALDDAVLRRLPRRLLVDLPDQAGRESILRILLKDDSVANDVDFSEIARLTPNYSGSDLKNVARAAAERLLRRVCDSDYNKKLANINKIGHENPNCSLSMSVENADIVDSSRDQNFNQKDPIDGTKSSACESSTNLPSDSLISKSIINKSNPLNQNYNVKIASNYGSSILAASPDQMLDVKTFPEIKDERNEKNIENLADSNVKQIQITMQDLIVATEEISGSTSVNMSSIEELRRWDRQFGCRVGDSRSKRKAPSVLGFQ